MASTALSNLCRLTVMTTQTRVDLALPLDMSVAELLATLVRTLGPKVADEGSAAGGFVLQRAGEAPLDHALTLRASQVRDGDVLHLRVRAAQLPEIAYDDVLDAVATGVLTRSVRWSPDHTARACLVGASAGIAFVLVACLLSGPSWTVPASIAGGLSVLLLGSAVALDRAYRHQSASLTAAGWAIVSGTTSAAMLVGGDERPWEFGEAQALPAAAAAVLLSVLGLALLTRGVSGFVAVTSGGLIAVAGAAAADLGGFDIAATAAFTAGIALLVSPGIPMVAFKLSRLSLPFIPGNAADLQRDHGTIDSTRILQQAARADQIMTGIVIALAAVLATSALVLAQNSTASQILAGVLAGICLLRARLFTSRSQRTAMLLAAAVSSVALVAGLASAASPTVRLLAVVVPMAAFALAMLALVTVLPGRRYAPPSRRTADVLESLLVLSVLPLILGIIGVYQQIRELTS